jgi:transcriptional regulator with XRE-family HTH domain
MTAELAKIISINIKTARSILKYSQAELAERSNLSTSYLAMIELGKRSPSLASLEALAKALQLEVFELLMPPDQILPKASATTLYNLQTQLEKNMRDAIKNVLSYGELDSPEEENEH